MKNENSIHSLCQYYSRALMYEFSLNDRDEEFINRVSDVSHLEIFLRHFI